MYFRDIDFWVVDNNSCVLYWLYVFENPENQLDVVVNEISWKFKRKLQGIKY